MKIAHLIYCFVIVLLPFECSDIADCCVGWCCFEGKLVDLMRS